MKPQVLLASLAAAMAASAAAAPPAPEGWSAAKSGAATVYRPDRDPAVELRLHAPDADRGALDAWFAARTKTAPSGVAGVSFGEPNRERETIRLAVGVGDGAAGKTIVVAIACERRDRKKQYAELVGPPEMTLIERYADAAATIAAQSCKDAAPTETAAASSPAPAAPQKRAAASGKGLKDADIAHLLYSWDQVYEIGGLQYKEYTYLLLKDGGARRDAPDVPPSDFDVAADRRDHPENWGRWKKEGGKVLVDFGDGFEEPPGQLFRTPGRRGERLAGVYEGASSYAIPGGAAAWSNWGLALDRDGRFRRWKSGGAGGSVQGGEHTTTTGAAWDDKGSASVVSAPNFGGGSSSTTGVTDADLQGTYVIDGWSMELRYDSGRVQRGFFFTDAERRNIWFEGAELSMGKR